MTDINLSRPGVTNLTTDGTFDQDNALFLKVFSGEVLTAFEESVVMKSLHLIRTISHGKSASFPAVWKADASYHVPGTPILGNNKFAHNERIIKIDDLLIADTFLYELDELKNHFDVRGIYSKQLGQALAREFDKKCLRVAINTSRMSGDAFLAGHPGGTVLKNTSAATDGEVLATMIFGAAQALDEKDAVGQRSVIVSPAQYYLMAQTTKLLNKDWGGSGVYADGTILKIADVTIVKSNNMPTTNITSATSGENNDYTGDFTDTVGVVFESTAMGTVKLMDLVMQMTGEEIKALYQGTLMVSKMAVGHGSLRPEAAVEISKAV